MRSRARAELNIAEAVAALLRGYRISTNLELADAALAREQRLEPELKRLRLAVSKLHPELNLTTGSDLMSDLMSEPVTVNGGGD